MAMGQRTAAPQTTAPPLPLDRDDAAAVRTIHLPDDGGAPDLARASILFIGAATVLIRYAGFTILTDPCFLRQGEVARLGFGLRSMRLTEPARQVADLPPLDAVVLSHLHGDHFDRVAARDLPKSLPIVTTLDAAATLRRHGFGAAQGLRAWQTLTLARGEQRLRVTALPGTHATHLGGLLGALLPPVMGSLLEFQSPAGRRRLRLYHTGDTLVYPRLAQIAARFPDIDVMLPNLGGTRLLDRLLVTMDGRQGVELMRLVPARLVVPIHFDDFTVYKSPLEEFRREVEAAGLGARVRYLGHGDEFALDVPPGA